MPWPLGDSPLTLSMLMTLADADGPHLVMAPGLRGRLEAMYASLAKHRENGHAIYGLNTGFGGNALGPLPDEVSQGLQSRLTAYLDCGTGPFLDAKASRAALAARLHVLSLNHSAVSPQAFETLLALFNAAAAPVIPRYGSLGASGDLITMAPLARLVAGDDVPCWHRDRLVHGPTLMRQQGIAPTPLAGRDGLAIMNGLSVSAALIACELHHCQQLFSWSLAGIAATAAALGALPSAFNPIVNSAPARRHKGQAQVAAAIAQLLADLPVRRQGADRTVQDEYSLRCIPQTLGPVSDLLALYTQWVEDELNSTSDNPVFLPDTPPQSGGNFFGGYLVMAADGLAQCLARLGDALERQTFLMVDGRHGLPANLTHNDPATGHPYQHGLKGVHQLATSLAMDGQRMAIPAALFSRSAEIHNQDIVSNAMNAATRLTELRQVICQLVAAHALMAAQAFEIADLHRGASALRAWHETIRESVPFVTDDRPLRDPLMAIARRLNDEKAPLPANTPWKSGPS